MLKCHKPQLFVAEMSDCKVLETHENGLKRIVTFKEGMGPPAGKAEEEIRYFEPLKVCLLFWTSTPPLQVPVAIDRAAERYLVETLTHRRLRIHIYGAYTQAEFHMPLTSTRIVNIISPGPKHDSDPSDLYLTFTFEWHFPDLEAGSKQAEEKRRQMQELGTKTVGHTIDVLREMAERGEL